MVSVSDTGYDTTMRRICVFLGSNSGIRAAYVDAARDLGRELARRKLTLVYGGGSVGLMGELATAVLAEGGDVIGIIPEALIEKEGSQIGIHDLRVVASMHDRKAQMSELADGFVVLPGGIGTLEEFFEILTWAQLGFHRKPCGVLNTCNFYEGLIQFLDHVVTQGFLNEEHRSMLLVGETATELLTKFMSYQSPPVKRWINRQQI